jgi:bifunctional DNA-binding transcriptional regulator/antitoxin component of YhaV-PrlF toxin-antitoxin module
MFTHKGMKMANSSQHAEMDKVARGLPTKSAKIRALHAAGFRNAAIARFLKTRDQFVSNVLRAAAARRAKEASPAANPFIAAEIDVHGRVVIPAAYRQALHLEKGTRVHLYLEGDSVRLISRDAAIRRIQKEFAERLPRDVSLVDELIAERRREAEREERDN